MFFDAWSNDYHLTTSTCNARRKPKGSQDPPRLSKSFQIKIDERSPFFPKAPFLLPYSQDRRITGSSDHEPGSQDHRIIGS